MIAFLWGEKIDMALAIFDLDDTLLNGDSDFAFGQFMIREGIVEKADYDQKNQQFKQDYVDGVLDIIAYSRFCLSPLKQFNADELTELHAKFMLHSITPMLQEKAQAKIDYHKGKGDFVLVITATNGFVARPIAEMMQVNDVLATEPEYKQGKITANIVGTPCYQEGKVLRLQQWLSMNTDYYMAESYFYSDSINDLPLLQKVTYPVVVNPDSKLKQHALNQQWPILSFR